MPNVPAKTTSIVTRHEWVIGSKYDSTDAKDFRFGLHHVYREMEELGVSLENDDAFHVRAGDGGEVILFIDIEKES